MKDHKKHGIGFEFAFNGLKEAFIRERNFRIHLLVSTLVVIMSFILKLSKVEWLFVILAIQMVLFAELVNTIAERIIDHIKPEIHPNAKIIKDIGAAIVLLAAFFSVIIGLAIFLPKIINLL